MKQSDLCAEHQPLIIRFLLLFCKEREEPRAGGWFYTVKTLRGVDYVVRVRHVDDKRRGRGC